jgi:hypothetical protein
MLIASSDSGQQFFKANDYSAGQWRDVFGVAPF